MSPATTVNTTTGGKERIERITKDIYQHAFRDDPVFIYMLHRLNDDQRYEYLYSYFRRLLTAAGINGAIFEEAEDFSAATVLMLPGTRIDRPLSTLLRAGMIPLLYELGLKSCHKMLFEFSSITGAAKNKGLQGYKRYWYLFFIGTAPEYEGRGYASALLRSAQARAAKDNLPLWLEATTSKSMNVYSKNGFTLVDTMVAGKGKVGADGRPNPGGPGVTLWAMVWWPPKSQ